MPDVELALPTETRTSLDRVQALARAERAIATETDERTVIDDLAFVKAVKRALEAARVTLVRPLNTQVDAINARFKQLAEPVAEAERRLNAALLAWRRAETLRLETERAAAQQRADEAAAAERQRQAALDAELRAAAAAAGFTDEVAATAPPTEAEVPPAPLVSLPPLPPKTLTGSLGTVTFRREWTFRIVDPTAVPRAYCEPVPKLIRAAVQAGVREIAGVEIFEDESVAGGRVR